MRPQNVWLVLVFGVAVLARAGSGPNLVGNSGFGNAEPGKEGFGWELDLAAGENNECTVVAGRVPGGRALRLYHDELGVSYVSQEMTVEPWHWYVAEIWVNSEGMAALDFAPSVSLIGGRRVNGDRFHNDAFERPKKGWRLLRVVTHSAGQDRITLKMGGGGVSPVGWSGELLFCEPRVRECSQVEAAGWYPASGTRDPRLFGPEVDAARNAHGYVFQRGEVCRVARGFPNPFHIIGRMNAEAPEGRIELVLPAGVRFHRVQYGNVVVTVSDMPNGRQRVQLPMTGHQLTVVSELEPGEHGVGFVFCEWRGGYQLPAPVLFEGIEFPRVAAPKRAVVALDVYGYTHGLWEDDKAGLASQDAMIRDLRRLGFNRLQIWGGDPRSYSEKGIEGATSFGGSFSVDKEAYPESLAVTLEGKPSGDRGGLMCPSYRGPGLEANSWFKRVRQTGAMTSALTLDDEFYAMSGESPQICFCDRCLGRWDEWRTEHATDLAGIGPRTFARQPHKYRGHYDAWLRFRSDLISERFNLLRQAFHEAVRESGVKTTPQPMLGAFINDDPLVGLHTNESLGRALDYLANMVYEDGGGVRKKVAELAPASDGKLVVTLAPGYGVSPPGDVRSQVLEAMMGGARGFIIWNYNIGMTSGHLLDVAEAVKMFGPVEDLILDGELEDGYGCDNASVNLLARRRGDEHVILVSDYSADVGPVSVTAPGDRDLDVTDLFTGQVVARLDAEERAFGLKLKRTFRARLFRLAPPNAL